MMDEPVKVRGEVASEKEDEKDRWRGLEMERGLEGGMSGVVLETPPKALETKDVELARWCDIEISIKGSVVEVGLVCGLISGCEYECGVRRILELD